MVANKIHVSRQTISNWENEHSIPDLQSLLLLADLYSTTLDELVRGDLDMLDAKKSNQTNGLVHGWFACFRNICLFRFLFTDIWKILVSGIIFNRFCIICILYV